MKSTIFLEIQSESSCGTLHTFVIPCQAVEDARFIAALAKAISSPTITLDDVTLISKPVKVLQEKLEEFPDVSESCRNYWEKLDHGYEIIDELCDNVLGLDQNNLDYRYCNTYVTHNIMMVDHVD